MQIETKVKMTWNEIYELIAEKYKIQGDFELIVDDDKVVDKVKTDNEGWLEVPKDWKLPYCPDANLSSDTYIEIQRRNGCKLNGCVDDFDVTWVQEDCSVDIVKYRVISKGE